MIKNNTFFIKCYLTKYNRCIVQTLLVGRVTWEVDACVQVFAFDRNNTEDAGVK